MYKQEFIETKNELFIINQWSNQVHLDY